MRHFARWCLALRKPNDIALCHDHLDDIFTRKEKENISLVVSIHNIVENGINTTECRHWQRVNIIHCGQSSAIRMPHLCFSRCWVPLLVELVGLRWLNHLTTKHSHWRWESDNDAYNSQTRTAAICKHIRYIQKRSCTHPFLTSPRMCAFMGALVAGVSGNSRFPWFPGIQASKFPSLPFPWHFKFSLPVPGKRKFWTGNTIIICSFEHFLICSLYVKKE